VSTQDAKQEEKTLSDFIKEHEKLITVIGVFGALTAFFTTMENGSIIVIFSYIIFFLLCLELMTHFPKFPEYFTSGLKTIRLFTFQVLLSILVILFFGYVAYYQPATLAFTILISIFAVLFYYDQISIPVNIYLNKHQKTGKAVGFLAVLGLSLLIFLVFIMILGVILLALSYFGIITLPTPP
jgi:hypothetical protein